MSASAVRAIVAAGLLTAGSVECQQVRWTHTGTAGISFLNGPTAAIGDVDLDGWNDVVQAVVVYVGGQIVIDWEIWTYSGRDGTRLRSRSGAPGPRYRPWAMGTVGDVDGDGCGDYAVTWHHDNGSSATHVEIRSGRDEKLLWEVTAPWSIRLGSTVSCIGDADSDGRPDVGMTAPNDTIYGSVFVYSSSGQLLHRIVGSTQMTINPQGQQVLGRVGDIDRDGHDDFVVGGGIFNVSGGAIVFSGRTGQALVAGRDPQPGDNLGSTVDGCGDMDGDGVPDFVVGSTGGLSTPGLVTVFSGRDGQEIRTWRAADLGRPFGPSTLRSGGMDVDQDGVPDVLIGAGGLASIWILSGRDGSVIFSMQNQGGNLGTQASILGRQPGSPYPHFVCTQPTYGNITPPPFDSLGRLVCFHGSPRGVEVYGNPCAGTLGATPTIGLRHLTPTSVRISVQGAAPNAPAALMLGCSRTNFGPITLPFPLAPFGLPRCDLLTSIELTMPITTGAAGLAAGYAAFDLPGRLDPTGPFTVYAQWWCLPTSGFPGGLSNAVLWSGRQ